MCYLIQKYGFVLNGNRTNFLYNSQPPFLSMMVRDYYEVNPDKEWLIQAYDALKKEHDFWIEQRIGSGNTSCCSGRTPDNYGERREAHK
jgi:alpha,alpha-trehalase